MNKCSDNILLIPVKQEIKKFIGNKFDKVYVDIRDEDTYVCLENFEIKIA